MVPSAKRSPKSLVTNRHVLEGQDQILLRVNRLADEPTVPFDVNLLVDGAPIWHAHPDKTVDVAVLPINTEFLRSADFRPSSFREISTPRTEQR